MTIQVEKQNFSISTTNVSLALTDLKSAYPSIKDLNYESDASNLQYLLSILGFHVRINIDESIFTISRLPEKEDVKGDPYTTLTCLAKYMPDDGFINVNIDGKQMEFNTKKENVIVEDETIKEEADVVIDQMLDFIEESVTKRKGRPKKL